MNSVLFYLVLAYFMGSLPTAYLAGKWLKGIDIRQHGSGNVGATNAVRILGKGPGYAVFLIDFLKGALPVFLFKVSAAGSLSGSSEVLFIGLAALLGHVFTPFLGFKGGKGIATGAGMLAAGFPYLFLIVLMVWLGTWFWTRIVSISSLGAAAALVISSFFLGYKAETIGIFATLTAFIFWTHRSNLGRLLRGQEGKSVNKTK